MKIKIYEKGDLLKEVPIFTKGDPERWGGTSLGVYKVLSKNKIAFSNLAQSWMPWAIHIDGKYYIHGDNWYSGGRIDISPITGGCVRLSNENAKEVYDFIQEGVPILVTDKGFENDDFQYSLFQNPTLFPELSAESYLVADLGSGFIFKEKDFQKQLPIASLTKLMTAIVIAERVDLRKSILAKKEMIEPFKIFNWFSPKLEIGREYKVIELFYPLLIESSNDVAEALGYFLGKEETVRLMEEKARAILMEKTNFADVTGISENNLSTTEDLFYLARYILSSRPTLLKISKREEVLTFGISISFKELKNKNILFEYPNFLGGKTGYTKISKYTGIFILKFIPKTTDSNQERVISIILLGSESLEDDLQEIFQWFRENYFIVPTFDFEKAKVKK
ncbi:MAG: L,D-transpeptidase family protein [Patescibacteria group bacterium]|nr:L,D-transpeptidase family protein [Patescibacteria group bacterium]